MCSHLCFRLSSDSCRFSIIRVHKCRPSEIIPSLIQQRTDLLNWRVGTHDPCICHSGVSPYSPMSLIIGKDVDWNIDHILWWGDTTDSITFFTMTFPLDSETESTPLLLWSWLVDRMYFTLFGCRLSLANWRQRETHASSMDSGDLLLMTTEVILRQGRLCVCVWHINKLSFPRFILIGKSLFSWQENLVTSSTSVSMRETRSDDHKKIVERMTW